MEIFDEPSEMSVYSKGVISPYGRIECDPLETEGFIERDYVAKKITINLDVDEKFKPNDILLEMMFQSQLMFKIDEQGRLYF